MSIRRLRKMIDPDTVARVLNKIPRPAEPLKRQKLPRARESYRWFSGGARAKAKYCPVPVQMTGQRKTIDEMSVFGSSRHPTFKPNGKREVSRRFRQRFVVECKNYPNAGFEVLS